MMGPSLTVISPLFLFVCCTLRRLVLFFADVMAALDFRRDPLIAAIENHHGGHWPETAAIYQRLLPNIAALIAGIEVILAVHPNSQPLAAAVANGIKVDAAFIPGGWWLSEKSA